MRITKFIRWLTFGMCAVGVTAIPTQAFASGHGIDLKGKTVEWVIPFSESGGQRSGQTSTLRFSARPCRASRPWWLSSCREPVRPKVQTGSRSRNTRMGPSFSAHRDRPSSHTFSVIRASGMNTRTGTWSSHPVPAE